VGGPYADLDASLKGRPDAEAVAGLRRLAKDDSEAQDAIVNGPAAVRAYVGLRAALEGAPPSDKLPSIGAGPGDERTSSSWLAKAFARFHWPKWDMDTPKSSGVGLGDWVTTLMWGALALLAGLAVFLLARYVRFPGLRKKVALMDTEEPSRTADEWLEEANRLIAGGKYREAVRGLYVAGLLRLDEAGVARFDPHQTNWEHLRRIEASPKRPSGADVRGATGRFDRVWYGQKPTTMEDASAMRSWYDALTTRLMGASAQ
jgi:hypothetical protein